MRKHVIMFFSVFCCLWFCCGWFCSRSLDVSAETYTKWTVSETSSFYGTSIPCTYEVGGVSFSGSFEYAGTYGNDWISACNIETNTVLSTAAASSYDVLAYRLTNLTHAGSNVRNISIPVDIYVTGGFRTFWGICSSLETSGSPNPVFSLNSISDYPNNFVSGGSSALPSASSPQYYNASTIRFAYQGQSYYACTMRALTYDETDGTISQLNFDGSRFFGTGQLWLFVATPYSYGDVSHDSPTTTTVTNAAELPPITVNVDVDLGPVVSGLDGIAGQVAQAKEDVQGIATDISAIGSLLAVDVQQTQSVLYLDPIDTLPTLDYHQVIDDVDGVLDDIPAAVAGTASIWGIISAFFTSDSVWLWLVPLCIFLCLASFVLWRR